MLSFFRAIINSKVGVIVTFVVLGVIALAFAAGDVSGLRSSGLAAIGGGGVASVGKQSVSAADLSQRANNAVESARQRQPDLTMASFIQQGGVESVLEQIVSTLALDRFGHDNGMAVSKRTVDGQIASIPGLQGPTGQFDPAIYQRLLAERRMSDAQVRTDIARDTLGQQLIVPTLGASQVPEQLALPYASLLLEKRAGRVGFVPTKVMDNGAAPSDADVAAFYQRNIARYSLPERRVLRYAIVTPEMVSAKAVPTDAEIAAAYKQTGAKYAARETRTISSVIVADQAGANALAAKVKGGTTVADAARAAGLEAAKADGVDKAAFAGSTSPALADAAFAAARGGVVGPVRTPLGWAVARVDAITAVPGKTLAEATPEIRTALTKTKSDQALSDIRNAIDDALSSNATYDEVVSAQKLTTQMTPALTAQGNDPEHPDAKLDAKLRQVVVAGFQAVEGDAPQMVPVGTDGSFALVAIGRTVPAAPRPLAAVRTQVVADVKTERERAAARALANAILAKMKGGIALEAALAQAGKPLPAPRPIGASRAQLAANPGAVPPPLALLFSMAKGSSKLLEAPNNEGWFIVTLDRVERGNAAGNQAVIRAARNDIAQRIGNEYAQQLARAIRSAVGVKIDSGAVAKVKADLAGSTGN